MTNYVVLVKHESSPSVWIQFTAIYARSARAAITEALAGPDAPYKEGDFIAVPARNFRPVSVKVETKTALKFS